MRAVGRGRGFVAPEPTAPVGGPFGYRIIEGDARRFEVYSQTGGGAVLMRVDTTGLNVNARTLARWVVLALNAKWNVERSIAHTQAVFRGDQP